MDVILMERVGKLGHIGDTVRVKDGFARNFLLPRGKALRATENNKKNFESHRADREGRNQHPRPAAAGFSVHRNPVSLPPPIKAPGLHKTPVHLHPEVEANVTINVARSPEQAERQAKGEDLSVREETSMDDLGLEVGRALAEAGPNASFDQS